MIQKDAQLSNEKVVLNHNTNSDFYGFLSGGGEMGERIRNKDWSQTPLGPFENWPPSLQTIVRIMLTSRQPIWIGWGPELIKLYNDPYKAIVGGKHPQALGEPASVVWRDIWSDIEPMLKQVMEKNEGTYVESQLLIMERYGYPEETYYTFSYNPVPSEQGGVGGMICTNTDDTQRVIGERQLALLRTLAAETADARTIQEVCQLAANGLRQNSHDIPFAMIYLVDPDKKAARLASTTYIEKGHSAAPEKVSLDTASSWPFAEVSRTASHVLVNEIHKYFDDLPTGAWKRSPYQAVAVPIVAVGETGQAGILLVGLNPFRKYDEAYQSFIQLVAGQIASSIANAQSYEEERKRVEALAEIDRAKTTFFSNVSHEFRTPLTLMLGPIEDLLAEKETLSQEQQERTEILHRNSLRLLRLVNALLDFSRIEAGRVQAVYEPTDLAAYTAELASSFRSATEKAGLQLVVETTPTLEPVYIDREMWEKIVLNLLSNAFKYTLQGSIKVTLQPLEHAVEFAVADTGIGIPEAEMPHLFERFHRVEGVEGRTHEGTGIGLALVQELVKLHGGTITAKSAVGRGSTFKVTIPIGTSHLPQERISGSRNLASTATGATAYVEEAMRWLAGDGEATEITSEMAVALKDKDTPQELKVLPHVLLADDNADMREYIKRLLSPNYWVEAVPDGEAALSAIQKSQPDLVLTDVMMPKMNGFGLLKALRANPKTRTLPVIMLSARAGEEARIEGLDEGADDYLVKPFSARELLARVGAHLALACVRQEAQEAIKRSSDEAERQRKLLYQTFMQAPVAISVLGGPDLVYELVNPITDEMIGNRKILGKPLHEAFPELSQETWDNHHKVYETGEAYVGKEFPTIADWDNNGQTYMRYWDFVYEPRRDESGQVDGVISVAIDVTAQVLARQKLEESQERWKLLANTVPAYIWTADATGNISYVSDKWLEFTGVTPANALGSGYIDTLHPDDREENTRKWHQARETETVFENEVRWRRFDGEYRWIIFRAEPVRDGFGKIVAWFGSGVDITERKELERRRDDFIGIASHELKTPLSSIKGYTQLLERMVRETDNAKAKLYLAKTSTYIDRLNSLITDLLDVSRIQAGKLQFDISEFDFDALVKDGVESIQPTTTHHQIEVRGKADIKIEADRNRLEQVLTNLLTNAIKYSPQATKVIVRVKKNDATIEISVQDFGIGIPKEKQARIFERFYRVESSAKSFPGLGIGLYISNEIVERHGGKLKIESEEGQGSVFTIILPLTKRVKEEPKHK